MDQHLLARPEVFLVEDVFKGPFDVKLLERDSIQVDIAGRACSMNFALSDAQDMWCKDDVELGIWARVGEPTGKLRSTTLRDRYPRPADAIVDVPGGALVLWSTFMDSQGGRIKMLRPIII